MSRLFISHSSKDNVAAKAFKQWLCANDWLDEDVFLDLDDIGAGERWKEALRKANARCEAVILLATPEALSSIECLAEVRKAEDYGKEIIILLLRDVHLEDRRLDAFKDRQIVNLASAPQSHIETVNYRGEAYEACFNGDALSSVKDYLFKRGISPDHFAWPPQDRPDAEPYPGLTAFAEADAGIFFGRDADILRGLDKVRVLRRNGRPHVLVIQAASGAGKSSYLRAGLWPRLNRDPDFEPVAILRPAKGILTGPEGLGHKLATQLSRPNRPINPGDVHAQLMAEDEGKATASFRKLVSEVAHQAHERRQTSDKDARAPALLLAVDQAEELFAAEDETENARFLSLLTKLLGDPPATVELLALLTIRAEIAPRLLQFISERGSEIPDTLPLLPLPQTSYRDVILEPLKVLARRGQRVTITPPLAERLTADARGADALPLLAFTLSHLYREFSAGGTITVEHYEAMGGVAGSIELALRHALAKPGDDPIIPATRDVQLECMRGAFIPWLARVNPETGLPMRRVARMAEFPSGSLAMVKRLVEARLLVADRRSGDNVVEIAHESLLRQWPEIQKWLEADGEELKLIESVERAAGEWERNDKRKDWLAHRGTRFRLAEQVSTREDFRKRLGDRGLSYLRACRANQRLRRLKAGTLICSFLLVMFVGGTAWRYQRDLKEYAYWFTQVRGHVLTAKSERALNEGESFQECTDCPMMIVVPSGNFLMGSPDRQGDKTGREYPLHKVAIDSPFAVGKFELTFAEWDACAAHGSCDPEIASEWGRSREAVINVTWDDAERYVAWLSKMTSQPYRLLSEAEYEYAARAGAQTTAYPWGNSIGNGNARCGECDDQAVASQPAAVGSFAPNHFGLYDMIGNVFEWVDDCFHGTYDGAPSDGAPWPEHNCTRHVVRGGAWLSRAAALRSAFRDWHSADERKDYLGFRVARTIRR